MNEAIPSGRETSIELDVHREQGRGVRRGDVGTAQDRLSSAFGKVPWFDPGALRTGEEASAMSQAIPSSKPECGFGP